MSILLGTGGGECIPALFCDCDVCRKARALGGKLVRTRTDFMIDEENIIDFGPDVYLQCVNAGVDLLKLKNIFLTHFHEDHLSVDNLIMIKNDVKIYANQNAIDLVKQALPIYKIQGWADAPDYFKHIEWVAIEPFKTFRTGGLTVTPVLAAHKGYAKGEMGYNYVITNKENKTFLYAADTGYYSDETFEFLKKSGVKLDHVVMECCYGTFEQPKFAGGHLDFGNLHLMLKRFKEIGVMSSETPIYLTHICHLNTLESDKITEMFKEFGFNVTAGYDGMKI